MKGQRKSLQCTKPKETIMCMCVCNGEGGEEDKAEKEEEAGV